MKCALAAMCLLVLLAVAYLSVSLIVLGPPRANLPLWFALAAVIAAQSLLTLLALSTREPSASLRAGVVAGAFVLAAIAGWRVRATLVGSHFEGYNLLLGAMLLVQATLTTIACGRARFPRTVSREAFRRAIAGGTSGGSGRFLG